MKSKIAFMETWIEKNGPAYRVNFSQGVQGFTFSFALYEGTKEEAERMKEQLDKAFEAYKDEILNRSDKFRHIKDAIFEVMGLSFDEYTDKKKTREGYYARMIFVDYCVKKLKLQPSAIDKVINRDRCSVIRCVKTWNDEFRLNRDFRLIAVAVENYLCQHVSD